MIGQLDRYNSDPRFYALVQILERVIESHGPDSGHFTTGELRDAFTLALQRHEMLTVRTQLVTESRRDG